MAIRTESPSLTFQVDEVVPGRFYHTSRKVNDVKASMLTKGETTEYVHLEDSLTRNTWLLTGEKHAFFQSFFSAYTYHHGIVFSADMLLQLILEGLAVHVSKFAEQLRTKFVHHEGKQTIELRRDDLVLGSASNDWSSVVQQFCNEIRDRANPDVYNDLIGESFSTTTPTDLVCRQVALMSTVKHYFSYRVVTRCGYPTVTLLGTRDDYVLLETKISQLGKYMMPALASTWIPALESMVTQFIDAWDGKIDKTFWGSMCKYGSNGGGSGPRYTRVSGWINMLFPYIGKEDQLNPYCISWPKLEAKVRREKNSGRLPGSDESDFTRRFCFAPVEWEYLGQVIPLRFKAGFVGSTIDTTTKAVTPQMTWAIVHPDPSREP